MAIFNDVNKAIKVTKKKLATLFNSSLTDEVKTMIEEAYEEKLFGVVPKGDLGRPEDFYDLFVERLNNFEFVRHEAESLHFNCPSIDTFDFSGALSFLKVILEGIVGFYYIIPSETYRLLGYTPPDFSTDIYLINENDPLVNDITQRLGKQFLNVYAFSNSGPIDIFSEAKDFIDTFAHKIIKNSLVEITNKIEKDYSGRVV